MSRKTVVKARCALCGAKEVSNRAAREKVLPRLLGQEDCRRGNRRARIRAETLHPRAQRREVPHLPLHAEAPVRQLLVVDDGYDLFMTLVLYPNFGWDDPAYHLEGDPEGRLFSELLVDVVAAEVIEPWGGGSGTWKSSAR
jgi:hypothetical protein